MNFDETPHKPYYGKYKGFVRDNADPEKRGRIRCFCPQVMGPVDGASHWLHWAEPNFPWLGGINTLDFGPPLTKVQNGGVEIGIWVEFEGGNVDFPIWTGTWIPAPTPTDTNAQIDLADAGGLTGGSIVDSPPAGSTLEDLNPPQPQANTDETRFLVKEGREIMLGSKNGGYILIGPYGVAINGVQVLMNGKLSNASAADKVVE